MKRQFQTWWVCLLVVLVFPWPCKAEGDTDKTLAPYFFVEGGESDLDRFPLKRTEVEVNINGVIADVRVRQRYTNQGGRPLHGRYIFPASTRAAVHGMSMTIGEQVIRAEIRRKEQAREIFDEAKTSGKSASLLSQQRPNVFSMDVANVLPGDTIDIELHYSELLVPENKVYAFVFPTVVGPRYGQQVSEKPHDHWRANPYLQEGEMARDDFALSLRLAAGMPVMDLHSPSHRVQCAWQGTAECGVRLDAAEQYSGNRDFILRYRLAGEQIASGLLLHEGEEENYFVVMMQPPSRLAAARIPPREYLFVVDVSGSMNGFPLDTAKKMLQDLIGGLRSEDKFNVLLFAGDSKVLAPESVSASPDNIATALRFIDKERGGGGTELGQALRRGLKLPVSEGYSRTMLVVTDGYIAAEQEVFQLVRENLNRSNLFAFGIGTSVNRLLIEGLARAGAGEPFIVTGPTEAPEVARRFQQMVSQPVLTNIQVDFAGFNPYDVEPLSVPDLFADRPVLLFGKWRGDRRGEIRVRGQEGGGRVVEQRFSLADAEVGAATQPLRTLWARQRLMRIADFAGTGTAENREEIASLGLGYNLLTSETSFVAVQDVVRNPGGQAEDVSHPLPLPQGVPALAVGVAKTPEPEMWLLLLGVLLALVLAAEQQRHPHLDDRGEE
ncbi:MAG: hypothetical protein BWK76_02305 [Desulfobulbaceae bacterium A2]|nr:MAG: hypothetical protein BWK76_02305 [Desulfobulbaceae bacterium A2]